MIVGVGGTICSGKGEFSKYFIEGGFERLAFGEEVKREAISRGIELSRGNLQELGEGVRQEVGAGVWAKRLLSKARVDKNYVVEGFRYPDQVQVFKNAWKDFYLAFIDGPVDKRFEWNLKRGGEICSRTFEEFREADNTDLRGYKVGSGQNSEEVARMADSVLYNCGTVEDLRSKAQGVYDLAKNRVERVARSE